MKLAPIQWRLIGLFAVGNGVGSLAGGLFVLAVLASVGAFSDVGVSGSIQFIAAYVVLAFWVGLVYLAVISVPIAYFLPSRSLPRCLAAFVLAVGPGLLLLLLSSKTYGLPAIVHGVAACGALWYLKVHQAPNTSFKRTPDGAA